MRGSGGYNASLFSKHQSRITQMPMLRVCNLDEATLQPLSQHFPQLTSLEIVQRSGWLCAYQPSRCTTYERL